MPFLGIALQEHFKAQPIAGTQLTAMAQYILLFFLYEKTNAYYSKMQISQSLGISLMIVDSFSLALSFKGELDEAVKLNINKLLM